MIAGDGHVVIEHDGELVARHLLVAPGEVAIIDDHYGGPRRAPARACDRARVPRNTFLALGPIAEAFLRAAAAAGTPSSPLSSRRSVARSGVGRDALLAALERAVTFRRFKAADVRSILEAGGGVVGVADKARIDARSARVPTRSLDAYRLEDLA